MLENEQLQGKISIKKCVENEILILLFSLPVIVIERGNIGLLVLCILPALSYLISIVKLTKGKEIEGPHYILHNGILAGCFTVIFALDGLEILLYLFSGTERIPAIFIVSAGYVFAITIWGIIVRKYRKKEYDKAKKIRGSSFFGLFGVTGILVARTLFKNVDNNTAWEIVCACCFWLSYLSLGGIFNIFESQYIKQHSEVAYQKIWCCYLARNIWLLLPIPLLSVVYAAFPYVFDDMLPKLPKFALAIFLLRSVSVCLMYWILKFTYLHIIVEIGFVIFAVYILITEKNVKDFLLTLILTTLSIVLNLHWITLGEGMMGV